jgi:hypothetical protein
MVAAKPENTSERAQTALASFVVMTVSSDAFVCSLSAPHFKHQLRTWHEHGRGISFHIDADLPGVRE